MHRFASHSPPLLQLLLIVVVVASLLLADNTVHSFGIGRFHSRSSNPPLPHDAVGVSTTTTPTPPSSSSHENVRSDLKSTTGSGAAPKASTTTSASDFGPRIEVIRNTQEYLDFIAQDDRLCVVKWVRVLPVVLLYIMCIVMSCVCVYIISTIIIIMTLTIDSHKHTCNRFYASWCKSCQKFGFLYKRLALQRGDVYESSTSSSLSNQQKSSSSSSSHSSSSPSSQSSHLWKRGDVRFAEVEFSANAELCRSLGIKKLPNIHIYKNNLGRITGFPCGPSKFPILEETLDRLVATTMSDDDLRLEKTLEEGGELVDQILEMHRRKEHHDHDDHHDHDNTVMGNTATARQQQQN